MLMRLRMLKLCVGKGRQVLEQLYSRVLQYYATVAAGRAGYVLYRVLVMIDFAVLFCIKFLSTSFHSYNVMCTFFVYMICVIRYYT